MGYENLQPGVLGRVESRDPFSGHPQLVAHLCYSCSMPRARISTTVDEDLLKTVRRLRAGVPDSVLVEEALAALVARNRAAEVDAAYAAYDKEPLDTSDEWGDLASFRAAAAGS